MKFYPFFTYHHTQERSGVAPLVPAVQCQHHNCYWLRFYVPLNTKYVILETFPKPISWLGMEKQTFQRHPAWKWSRPILVSALHKFVTYLLS